MRFFCRYVCAIAVFLLLFAHAYADDSAYNDWPRLQAILESEGVNIEQTNWAAIDQRCLGLQSAVGETGYPRCEFENALLLRDFNADTAACKRQEAYERSLPPCSTEAFAFGGFDQCMLKRGWSNSQDWSSGKQTHRYNGLVQ